MVEKGNPPVSIDAERCIGCGLCVQACGRKLIVLEGETARVAIPERCVQCGHCKAVCSVDAPRLTGLDPEEYALLPENRPGPDELLSFLRSRRSIRQFSSRQVEQKKLEMIIQAGRYAPTGQNRQALGFVVVRDPARIDTVRDLTIEALQEQAVRLERMLEDEKKGILTLADKDQPWRDYPPAFRMLAKLTAQGHDPLFHNAPALVAVHVHPHKAMHPEVEAGMAAMQMGLMATSQGLGTCYCGLLDYAAYHKEALRQAMDLPEGHHVPISFILGYPDLKYRRLVARQRARVTWL